jgi:DNA (cytosine-5)-methyltransferase 1
MRVLDLFCGAGGAGKGYADAGFEVVGVDIEPQPRYPFYPLHYYREDALVFLERNKDRIPKRFDLIHASPPCQAFTNAQRIQDRLHPDLVSPTRELLKQIGLPYVIENVVGAPLVDPVLLCGAMFSELKTYRHRLFETSFGAVAPPHPKHVHKQAKMGRPPQDDEWIQVVGNFSGVEFAREAMGIDWMTRDELREAIPPAYTRYIAEQLFAGT